MADSTPSPSSNRSQNATATTITDLNADSLSHSAAYLNLQDVCNLAMTCRYLKRVAYSDSIWQRFFWEHWQQQPSSSSLHSCGVRETYLARRTAVQQFKFIDPLVVDFDTDNKPSNHLLLSKNEIFSTQGSVMQILNLDRYQSGKDYAFTLSDHKARITCMSMILKNLLSDAKVKSKLPMVFVSIDSLLPLVAKGCFPSMTYPYFEAKHKRSKMFWLLQVAIIPFVSGGRVLANEALEVIMVQCCPYQINYWERMTAKYWQVEEKMVQCAFGPLAVVAKEASML